MNNFFFNKFVNSNKPVIKKFTSNKNILVVDRGKYDSIILQIISAAALNEKYKANVFVLSNNKKNSSIIKFYRSFGFKYFNLGINLFNFNYFFFFKSIFILFIFLISFKKKKLEWFINNFKVDNILIGDLIYDSYIRSNFRFINPKIDFNFIKIILVTVYKVLDIENYLKKIKAKHLIVSTSGKATNTGIATRIAIFKKIKVIQIFITNNKSYHFIMNNYYTFKNGQSYKLHYILRNKKFGDIKRISETSLNKFIIKRFFKKKKNNYTGYRDIAFANKNKRFFSRKELLNKLKFKIDDVKKIILIAPHAFSDSPHDNGVKMIFNDYYSHLRETLEFLNKIEKNNILWLVRPHPTGPFYGEENIVKNLVDKISNQNIKLCPSYLNSYNLSIICDNVVTTRGTIAMEFACQGKRSLIAAVAPYSGIGFSLEPKTKEKYFSILSNIDKLSKLNKTEILNAKKVLYFLEHRELPNKLKKCQLIEKVPVKKNNNFFNKKLIDNFKKLDYSIKNDLFFKSIIKTKLDFNT